MKVIIEMSSEGRFSCYMDDDNTMDYGVIGTGATVEEAKRDFDLAYSEMREHYREEGKPFEEINYEFEPDYSSMLDFYGRKLSIDGLHRITGVAPDRLQEYMSGEKRPTRSTMAKIQDALHSFGTMMSRVAML